MDIAFMILCAVIVIGLLVFIHEGGHYLAARLFGVRVTEFMIGLPGPKVGFQLAGTKFGVTAVPLGGYAKVCGMETGPMNEHLSSVLAFVYENGSADASQVAEALGISEEDAEDALDELVQWGSILPPRKHAEAAAYSTPDVKVTRKQKRLAKRLCQPAPRDGVAGDPIRFDDEEDLFKREYSQQYRSLPFWKRSVILLAGIFVNLLFALVAFVVIYSIIGFDITTSDGTVQHFNASVWQAIQAGFNFIGMTLGAIFSLFNPQTAAETVSNSTSIMGIAVMSADYFAAGFQDALFFMAMISVSLGLMNLLPIPPLDGGRFLIEIIQKVTRKEIPMQVMGYISMAGMALFLGFFVIMLNQDIQRFVFGNW